MAGMFDDLVPKQPNQKGGMFDDLVPQQEKGFFQQPGGLADFLPESLTSAFQTVDDLTQSAGDVVTRGWGSDDKLTEAARERTGAAHIPTDIVAGVASAPYRIGGALTGGAFGAGEGALRSYGNQEGWTPEWGNIGRDATIGAGLGFAGAGGPQLLQKVGEIPKLTAGAIDYMTTGMPILLGAKGASSVLPTGPVTRDLLAKTMINQGLPAVEAGREKLREVWNK